MEYTLPARNPRITELLIANGYVRTKKLWEENSRVKVLDVEVKSTLGAGDTFKAGCVYAPLHGMNDEETVRFASACSAVAISRFPLPRNPPKLSEVRELIKRG